MTPSLLAAAGVSKLCLQFYLIPIALINAVHSISHQAVYWSSWLPNVGVMWWSTAVMMNSISDGGCIKTELYGNTPALLYRLSKCVLIEMELAEPRRSLSCSSS